MPEQSTLPALHAITRLSPRVIRILGDNPGPFTLQGTNTYLVGTGTSRILIDSGEGRPGWKAALSQALTEEKATISKLVISHWHPDHVGGIADCLSLAPEASVHKSKLHLPDIVPHDIQDGEVYDVDGATLRAFFCPGHTADHMAFILEEEDSMFTADNVLGHGTAVFEDLSEYLRSLERMQTQFRGRVYPGHGEVVEEGPSKIAEYIAHRKERLDQVLTTLRMEGREETEKGGWTAMDVVRVVYKGYPESLHLAAERGAKQMFGKLQADGVIEGIDGKYKLSGNS